MWELNKMEGKEGFEPGRVKRRRGLMKFGEDEKDRVLIRRFGTD